VVPAFVLRACGKIWSTCFCVSCKTHLEEFRCVSIERYQRNNEIWLPEASDLDNDFWNTCLNKPFRAKCYIYQTKHCNQKQPLLIWATRLRLTKMGLEMSVDSRPSLEAPALSYQRKLFHCFKKLMPTKQTRVNQTYACVLVKRIANVWLDLKVISCTRQTYFCLTSWPKTLELQLELSDTF